MSLKCLMVDDYFVTITFKHEKSANDQIFIVLSPEADIKTCSTGENAMSQTPLLCPVSVAI